jgi:hypothetical protein
LFLLLLGVVMSAGCLKWPQVQDVFIPMRKRFWAHRAWNLEKPKLEAEGKTRPWLDDYGTGFRAGYYDIAMGGSGTIPLLPPTKYWGAKYHNPTGREEVEAWFAGYDDGVVAGQQDAVGQWMPIQTSGGEEAAIAAKKARRRQRAEPIPTGIPVTPELLRVSRFQPPTRNPPSQKSRSCRRN